MLPESYCQAYHALLKQLLILQKHLGQSDHNLSIIAQTFERLQEIFSEQILKLTQSQIDPALTSRWQSIQTEIHRDLRLLATDMLFWRTSKQNATKSARLTTMSERLSRLIDYCQFMDKGM